MICDLRKTLRDTPVALTDFVDMTDLPSMPYPPHTYTHLIRAIDRHGAALLGEAVDKIKAVSAIVASPRYKRARRSFSNITNWDTEDVGELHEMFAALKAIFANPSVTISDVVDLNLVPTARFPKGMPKDDIWVVDQNGYALIGKDADTFREVGHIIEDAFVNPGAIRVSFPV